MQSSGGLQLHALANRFLIKIPVAGDLDLHHLVALALVNIKNYVGAVGGRIIFCRESYFGFKVAFGLKIVAYVTAAFSKQIVVHRVLLVNRDVFLDEACA